MRKLSVLFLGLSFFMSVHAQDNIFHSVPKELSFDVGYQNLFSARHLNNFPHSGSTFTFDYAWQLSGFSGKPAGYLSVPLSYSMFYPSQDGQKALSVLTYGWTVRHMLATYDKKIVPFVGYALLLSNMKQDGVDGGVMGHQTKFEFGFDFPTKSKGTPFVKLEYALNRFSLWGNDNRMFLQFYEVKLGCRFKKKAKYKN